MGKYCGIFVNIFQFITAICVMIMCLYPAELVTNRNVTTIVLRSVTVTLANLICVPDSYDVSSDELYDLKQIVLGLKSSYEIMDGQPMVGMAKCFKQVGQKNNSEAVDSKCFCFGNYSLISAAIFAAASLVYCLVDCILAIATLGKNETLPFCAFVVTLLLSLGWVTVASVLLYFLLLKWPFMVYQTTLLVTDAPVPFFFKPLVYWIAVGFCYVLFMLFILECLGSLSAVIRARKKRLDQLDSVRLGISSATIKRSTQDGSTYGDSTYRNESVVKKPKIHPKPKKSSTALERVSGKQKRVQGRSGAEEKSGRQGKSEASGRKESEQPKVKKSKVQKKSAKIQKKKRSKSASSTTEQKTRSKKVRSPETSGNKRSGSKATSDETTDERGRLSLPSKATSSEKSQMRGGERIQEINANRKHSSKGE